MSYAVKMNGANIDTKIALKTQGFLQISFLRKGRKCENVTQAIHTVHPIPSLSDFMN